MGFTVQEIIDLACETFCFKEKAKEYFRDEIFRFRRRETQYSSTADMCRL